MTSSQWQKSILGLFRNYVKQHTEYNKHDYMIDDREHHWVELLDVYCKEGAFEKLHKIIINKWYEIHRIHSPVETLIQLKNAMDSDLHIEYYKPSLQSAKCEYETIPDRDIEITLLLLRYNKKYGNLTQ